MPCSCLEFSSRCIQNLCFLFFFLLTCALPQEGHLPLQTSFQTWSWTRKWGFTT